MGWGKDLRVIEHPSAQDPAFSASLLQNVGDHSCLPPTRQLPVPRGRGIIRAHTCGCPGRCSGCPTWFPTASPEQPGSARPMDVSGHPRHLKEKPSFAPASAPQLVQLCFISALRTPRCREPKPGSGDGGSAAAPPGRRGRGGRDAAMANLSFLLPPGLPCPAQHRKKMGKT